MKAHLHERELLDRRQSTHVHPARGLTLAEVISFRLDCSEGDSAQPGALKRKRAAHRPASEGDAPVDLHDHLRSIIVRNNVDIFPDILSQLCRTLSHSPTRATHHSPCPSQSDSRPSRSCPSSQMSDKPRSHILHTSTDSPRLRATQPKISFRRARERKRTDILRSAPCRRASSLQALPTPC
jgi:hypothetical protein